MNKTLKTEELDLIRQWFNALEDLKGRGYHQKSDYLLAVKIHRALGMRVPHDILRGAELPIDTDSH